MKSELVAYYRAYRDDISHISGNLNQSVKRANEPAVTGLLTGNYVTQVLMPEIQTTQRVLSNLHDELIKKTKKP